MKNVRSLLLLLTAAAPIFAAAPTWDSSGNSQLNGAYYFRQVIYNEDAAGDLGGAYAYFGNIAFNGAGAYTITAGTLVSDDANGYQSNPAATGSGTYSVSASGYGFMSSPITGQNVYFMVSNHIVVGSETESGYNDVFIAAPYNPSLSLSSLQGSYTVAGFITGSTAATALDYTFQLNPDGAGHLNTVSISGETGAGAPLSQSSAAVKYIYANGAFPITFPTNNTATFYSGQVYLYMSPDSNFVFGGSPTGFDLFVGVKNAASGASTPLSGLYYEAGFDENTANGLDSYYGVFNAFLENNAGNIAGHERILYSGATSGLGSTYYDNYPTTIANTYQNQSASTKYIIGQNGMRIGTGVGQYLSIEIGLPYTAPAATSSLYVDPTGIVNTASSAPYTAGISPGDFITLYNVAGLPNTTNFAPAGAFPTALGGVQVLIDGIAAPLYYVIGGANQISALVPYAASTYPIASIQVVNNNNNTKSNIVTTYVYQTTPGVFTSNPVGGIGVAAALDFPSSGGYFTVSSNQSVQPGDNIALFLTGLGTPFPPNGDGALGGTSCVSGTCLVNSVVVDINGVPVVGTASAPSSLAFAGLAPGLAGLYQINFTVPSGPFCTTPLVTPCMTTGANSLGITGQITNSSGVIINDSYADESYIPVAASSTSSAREMAPAVSDSASAQAAPAARRTLPRLNRPMDR